MGKLFKALLCLLVVAVCAVAPISANNSADTCNGFFDRPDYFTGYQDGYTIGYSDGFNGESYNPQPQVQDAQYIRGFLDGYNEGYMDGVDKAQHPGDDQYSLSSSVTFGSDF